VRAYGDCSKDRHNVSGQFVFFTREIIDHRDHVHMSYMYPRYTLNITRSRVHL